MESVFAAFFSYLILNDKLNKSQIIGIFIMFIGLIISEFYTLLKLKIKS
ncbi:MAG: EamA family transporter [Ignavibacteria bacterium]|nr:EamA family transporter [Ignavibacteria bacterium]